MFRIVFPQTFRTYKISIGILILVSFRLSFSQSIVVPLSKTSTLDDFGTHLVVFSDTPSEELILPERIVNPKYLKLFYSWDSENDETISVLICQNDSSDILFVDLNNDENLSNDGSPITFPLNENSVWFDIVNQNDIRQKTRLLLNRKPNLPDSLIGKFIDAKGNLMPKFAKMMGMFNGLMEYKGENRTFFFDDRMGVRKGEISFQNITIPIGLFDYTNNGIFNDEKDLVLIDLNNDNKLGYENDEEIFNQNDIVQILNKNYKFSYIDKYGSSITLQETKEKPTKYYSRLDKKEKVISHKYELEKDFWQYNFTGINGDSINLKDFKGKYLLLNFWGAWCKPCLEEIPVLVDAYRELNSKVKFISFIKTRNIINERKIIISKNMSWEQVELPKSIEEYFKIYGYPTNLLILPDGKSFIKKGMLNKDFFNKFIR